MLTKDTAICIRAVDYSETSQILTFFTRAIGKISAIAKGSKRPKSSFGGPIEIFACGKIVFTNAGTEKLCTLTEFEPLNSRDSFTIPQNNLFALNCCFFAGELLNKFTQDYDPQPELFDSFLEFLHNTGADENKRNVLVLLILFQLQLLKQIGLQPILSFCANCKRSFEARTKSDEIFFSSSANGVICRDCQGIVFDKIKLSQSAAYCLSDLRQLAQAGDKTLNEIERILIIHFTELLGYPPKMVKYFQSSLV
jgi:DNA repair protein RecO (recombination protein O)